MKNIIITSLLSLIFISCGNAPIKEKSYKVTYEVLYPQGSKQFNINTKEGKAKILKYNSGFFHGGPMIYKLIDKTYNSFAYEEFPIIIISQE